MSRIVKMIDEESWISLDADAKGDLYEGLLQRTPKILKVVLASTLRRAHSLMPCLRVCALSLKKRF